MIRDYTTKYSDPINSRLRDPKILIKRIIMNHFSYNN